MLQGLVNLVAALAGALRDQLGNFEDMLTNGEAVSIWYDLLEGLLLDDDRLSALQTARRLLKARP